ncbi:MAG: 16S rRNA (guanine(966)-N(2))-methyltransferase RsmD [Candidatus Competibacteraceae bacterium]|nr:16S rRNA (guanine(966)-N(2))-methyltransferase RsmD [Candidatus Competibacteraceae bacterium]
MAKRSFTSQLRIIGGRWRGRRLNFPVLDGLRPTPDRVRETLFNWLAPVTEGARCLDLFAGSGALGIEALSRGADKVVFVERHPHAAQCLRDNLLGLGAASSEVHREDVLIWLTRPPEPFDIVMMDPPFNQELLKPACRALEERGWLSSKAFIYLEAERAGRHLVLPAAWAISREKTAGQVTYRLAMRHEQ